MTDVYTVTWAFQPNPKEAYRIPRYATCLDVDTAAEVEQGLRSIGYGDGCVTTFAHAAQPPQFPDGQASSGTPSDPSLSEDTITKEKIA